MGTPYHCAHWAVNVIVAWLCPMGIYSVAMKRDAAAELAKLRGERTKTEWAELLGIPYRTYLRYEQGSRDAPEVVLRYARLVSARPARKKRGA